MHIGSLILVIWLVIGGSVRVKSNETQGSAVS